MFESINKFLCFWKALGVCQITMCATEDRKPILKSAHPAYYVYAAAIFIVTIVMCVQEIISTIEAGTIIMTKGTIMFSLDVGVSMIVVCAGISSSIYYRSRFSKILLDIENVESFLQKHLSPQNSQKKLPKSVIYSHALAYSCTLVTLLYDCCTWCLILQDNGRLSYQWMYITYLITTTMIMKFVLIVLYISRQFTTINSLFVDHMNFINDATPRSHPVIERNHRIQSKFLLRNLTNFLKIHDSLYRIIAETSVVFGPENLITLLFILEQLVCCPFYAVVNSNLFNKSKDFSRHFICLCIIWSCTALLLLLIIVVACSKVKDEALELKKIVSRHMNPLVSDCPNDYIHLYLMKLSKPYHGFSVFGIFELEIPLARHMIATALTYLTIFLQF